MHIVKLCHSQFVLSEALTDSSLYSASFLTGCSFLMANAA